MPGYNQSGSHPQYLPITTWAIVTRWTLYLSPSWLFVIFGVVRHKCLISRTCASVSLAIPCLSPRGKVPCSFVSKAFSLCVAHLKCFGFTQPKCPFPQLWAQSVCSGAGSPCASSHITRAAAMLRLLCRILAHPRLSRANGHIKHSSSECSIWAFSHAIGAPSLVPPRVGSPWRRKRR